MRRLRAGIRACAPRDNRSRCAARGLVEGGAGIYLRHATWLSSSPASSGRVQVAFPGWDSVRVQGTENYFVKIFVLTAHTPFWNLKMDPPRSESKDAAEKRFCG